MAGLVHNTGSVLTELHFCFMVTLDDAGDGFWKGRNAGQCVLSALPTPRPIFHWHQGHVSLFYVEQC